MNEPFNNMILLFQTIQYWQELIEEANYQYVFGEPIDEELFKTCMKKTYEYFFVENEPKDSFDQEETRLYGMVFAYFSIPVVTDNANSTLFEASLHAAGDLADAILCANNYIFEENKMICNYKQKYEDSGISSVTYDFETGDLSKYIALVEMHFWD